MQHTSCDERYLGMKITLELNKDEVMFIAKCLNERYRRNEALMIIDQIPKEDLEIMQKEGLASIKIVSKMNGALDNLIKN
jgi:hypothetical protein